MQCSKAGQSSSTARHAPRIGHFRGQITGFPSPVRENLKSSCCALRRLNSSQPKTLAQQVGTPFTRMLQTHDKNVYETKTFHVDCEQFSRYGFRWVKHSAIDVMVSTGGAARQGGAHRALPLPSCCVVDFIKSSNKDHVVW